MPETFEVYLLQNNPLMTFRVIDTAPNGGTWLETSIGHTLTSDGSGALSGVLRFGLDYPNHADFAVAVGLHDNLNNDRCEVIYVPWATQSAESILELCNSESDWDVIKGCDVTSADKTGKRTDNDPVTGPDRSAMVRIGD